MGLAYFSVFVVFGILCCLCCLVVGSLGLCWVLFYTLVLAVRVVFGCFFDLRIWRFGAL